MHCIGPNVEKTENVANKRVTRENIKITRLTCKPFGPQWSSTDDDDAGTRQCYYEFISVKNTVGRDNESYADGNNNNNTNPMTINKYKNKCKKKKNIYERITIILR